MVEERLLFNRFKKSPISPRGKEGERLFAHPERWDVTTGRGVSEIVAGMSTRTSFFILMVGPLSSPFLSNFSVVPPTSSFICFSLFPPTGDSTVAPLSAIPSPSLSSHSSFVSLFLAPLLPFLLLAPADSTAFFYLGANVLIACGRSSRPSRVPFPSVSSSSWLLRGHRPSKWLR